MSKKILIVDDSPTGRLLQSSVFKAAGFETDTASNGIEALEMIFKGNYSLIITDINMPKMDGLRLTQALREQEGYRDVPIIIVTSESEEDDKMKGIEAGANVYLVKPTNPEQLLLNAKILLGDKDS
jgi:two-component system chemotaxis response regulator CheY